MKNTTKKVALGLLATGTILSLWMTQTSAFGGGQWGGWLSQYVTAEEKAKMQSLSWDERTEYMKELKAKYNISTGQGQGKWQGQGRGQGKWQWNWQGQWNAHQSGHNQDPSALVDNIPMSDVNDTEKEILINQYGEERMARDLYAYAAEKYPNVNTFSNITKSEQEHMDALKVLLDRYDIDAPSDYAKDNDLYVTLKNKIDLSEKDAIEVWLMVEMVDIDNIAEDIRNTDNDDFKVVLTNIGWASFNHLKGFVNALNNAGYTTDLEWTKYISEDDLNARWNELKTKLAEKLEAEGVKLPEQATSKYLNENCNHNNSNWNVSRGQGQGKWNKVSNSRNFSEFNTKKEKYKTLLNTKYKAKIDALSEDKIKTILSKIDELEEKVKLSTTYTEEKKLNTIALLEALRDIIQEKIWDDDLIDNLFQ